jgi:hypothetical protein
MTKKIKNNKFFIAEIVIEAENIDCAVSRIREMQDIWGKSIKLMRDKEAETFFEQDIDKLLGKVKKYRFFTKWNSFFDVEGEEEFKQAHDYLTDEGALDYYEVIEEGN